VGGGSMGEKREEGFVFSFVFFFILPSSESLLRYFVTQYASAQIFAHFFLFLNFKRRKIKVKKIKKTSILKMKVLVLFLEKIFSNFF
jgi:hypothetical protein